MFCSEINISATADSRGSGLFDLDLSDAICNLSEGAVDNIDALDDRPAISSAGRQRKKTREMRQHCNWMVSVFLSLFDINI